MLRRLLLFVALLAGLSASPAEARRYLTITSSGGGQAAFVVVAPTLGVPGLTPTTATAGSGYSGTITGNTVGSTLSALSSDGTSLTVTGVTLTGTFAAAGSPTVTVTETLTGATGSPRSTPFSFTVSAAGATPSLDHSDANNSQYLLIIL